MSEDLISRQNAINVLEILKDKMSRSGQTVMEQAIAVLKDLHSAEPEERTAKSNKGNWNRRKGYDCWECSECHAVLEYDDIANHNFYYCYHCGADMMDKDGYMDLEKTDL